MIIQPNLRRFIWMKIWRGKKRTHTILGKTRNTAGVFSSLAINSMNYLSTGIFRVPVSLTCVMQFFSRCVDVTCCRCIKYAHIDATCFLGRYYDVKKSLWGIAYIIMVMKGEAFSSLRSGSGRIIFPFAGWKEKQKSLQTHTKFSYSMLTVNNYTPTQFRFFMFFCHLDDRSINRFICFWWQSAS